jgi:FMN phosphatase YigB (HAD superfamily)
MERTFDPFVTTSNPLPSKLQSQLYDHFASAKAYQLYSDVLPFYQDLRDHKQRATAGLKKRWEWDDIIVGIISNSDDRICGVLSDFGIRIAPRFVGTSSNEHERIKSSEDVNFMALSFNVGHSKPDSAIFNAAKSFANSLTKEQCRDTTSSKKTEPDSDQETPEQPYDNVYCHVGDELEADVRLEANAGWNTVLLDRSLPLKPISRFRRLDRRHVGPYPFEGHNLQTISQSLFDPTDESTFDAMVDPTADSAIRRS